MPIQVMALKTMPNILIIGASFRASIPTKPYKPVEYLTKNEQLILMSRMHKSLLMLRITQLSRSFQNG